MLSITPHKHVVKTQLDINKREFLAVRTVPSILHTRSTHKACQFDTCHFPRYGVPWGEKHSKLIKTALLPNG